MRYIVNARVGRDRERALLIAIDNGTLGKGSVASDEYIYDMEHARVNEQGVATWIETCFWDQPLEEERRIGKNISSCSRSRMHTPGVIAGMRMELSGGRVATVIARKSWKSGSRRKALRF